ncbi:MAG: hypothetical protein ACJAZK_002842 [Psychroserpens sp.]|uniref:FG-GAP-like repeat-containing protein n=1 Tax=Psychroserpens sp. TaxID=2020870 RepID=UPI0039E37153
MKYKHFIIIYLSLCIGDLDAQIVFENEATSMGMDVSSGVTFLGNGLSLADFDNDGWDDITLTTGVGQAVRFFKNVNGNFVEQIFNLPNLDIQTKAVNWVDIDNDGDKDLFVTSDTSGNKLFENTGSLVFQEISEISGMNTNNMFSYGASWGDYNNDSFLDVFISNRSEAVPNILYKNNGDNTFTDESGFAGISNDGHMSFCSVFFDLNNDGFQDIYISNDKYNHANIMYLNNGNGTFTDVSESSLTNISIDAMTTTIGDYNNDGWFDIYVTNTSNGNVLFKNQTNGTFLNTTAESGTSFNSIGWGAVFLDADNDKDVDLYVSGYFDGSTEGLLSAAFYENIGNETFSIPSNAGFSGDDRESYSNATADLNHDGLVDIVVNNGDNMDVFVWNNQSVTANSWLKVSLEGVQSNRDGIGAVIEISINNNKQYRYTHLGEGYLSQNSSTKSFGLGDATNIDYVKVTWLSGIEDVLYNVNPNQSLHITEGNTLSLNSAQINTTRLTTNPVDNLLIVKSDVPIIKLELYSIIGQEIMSSYNKSKINVSHLKSGYYFLQVTTNKGLSVLRFVKN